VSVRLYVFDLDGTLVDSLRDLAESANLLLARCGASPLEEAVVASMVGDGAATLVARVFAAAGVAAPADALARFLAAYETRLLDHTRTYEGMPAVLRALGAQASMAVLTNKPREATLRILSGLHLDTHFDRDAIVGGDEAFPRKPDPAGLAHLCGRAGISVRDTLMVGDSAVDWRTARAAGTQVCLARYGFGFRGFPSDLLRGDELIIDRPSDLLTLRGPGEA
jgi:phosphoglycolate phosphatase